MLGINLKVAGVGDNTVDIYTERGECFPGGNCVNFAVFSRRLGVFAAYIGVLGSDQNGQLLTEALRKEKVELSRVQFSPRSNAATLVRHEDGDRIFISSDPSTAQSLTITEQDLDFLSDYHLIHTSIYSKLENYLSRLSSLNCQISYDFSNRFSTADLDRILPWLNYGFFSWSGRHQRDILSFLQQWTEIYPAELLITNGADGSYALENDRLIHVPAQTLEPVDTMGVGDAFLTSYLIARLNGKTIKESLEEGTAFAAVNCLKPGSFGYKQIYHGSFSD